jgi:hypothetical protein
MDCKKIVANPYAQEEYALYLALNQLITPSHIIHEEPVTLEVFELLHPIATHRILQQMTGALMLKSGLEPIPIVEQLL